MIFKTKIYFKESIFFTIETVFYIIIYLFPNLSLRITQVYLSKHTKENSFIQFKLPQFYNTFLMV